MADGGGAGDEWSNQTELAARKTGGGIGSISCVLTTRGIDAHLVLQHAVSLTLLFICVDLTTLHMVHTICAC